ncbi:MAG: hypothetical protein E7037_07845 [Verrucomicrobia bacterium]|nr:hypothetical protein [Verrucomicrobiota bacterium]
MKVSATIYRFYRKELPAMTKAAVGCIVLWAILAFVVFSPGFTFAPADVVPAKVSSLAVAERVSEAGIFQDSEPLFLPTALNFENGKKPKELNLRETSFLPFGEILALYDATKVIHLEKEQILPTAEEALGADAWPISRGFSVAPDCTEEMSPVAIKTKIRIEEANTGKTVFSGTLEGIENDSASMIPVPAEYFCGIASGFGKPNVMTIRSCGNTERDKAIIEKASKIVSGLRLNAGIFRIVVE